MRIPLQDRIAVSSLSSASTARPSRICAGPAAGPAEAAAPSIVTYRRYICVAISRDTPSIRIGGGGPQKYLYICLPSPRRCSPLRFEGLTLWRAPHTPAAPPPPSPSPCPSSRSPAEVKVSAAAAAQFESNDERFKVASLSHSELVEHSSSTRRRRRRSRERREEVGYLHN